MALVTSDRRPQSPVISLFGAAWRVLVIVVLLVSLAADTFLPTPRSPSSQAVRLLHIRRVSADGSVVFESQPGIAGKEVELSVYGPVGDPSPTIGRDSGFLGLSGVQLTWLPEEDQEAEMILAAASGARSIGLDFEWKTIQPEAEVWDWEATDRVVRLAKKYRLRLVPMLLFTPEWASSLAFAPLDYYRAGPVDSALYRDFVYRVVQRYKPYGEYVETHDGYGITDWVIWNEPNVQPPGREPLPMNFWYGSLQEYIQLLRAGFEGAHAADPSCNVLNGGLADVYWKPGEADIVSSLERLYDPNGDGDAKDGGRPFFDTLNLHMYVPGTKPDGELDARWYQDRLDGVLRVMKRYGDSNKQIWITETGFGSISEELLKDVPEGGLPLVSEEKQAQAVPFVYQTLGAYPQVGRVFWWSLRSLAGSGFASNAAMEAHYGLVRANFVPKPAYLAYLEMNGAGLLHSESVPVDPSGITVFQIPAEKLQEPGGYFILAVPNGKEGAASVGWLTVP